MENLGSIGGQPCVYSGDLRELRGICGVEGSDLLVHFAKKSLPPDVLLQKKFRMRCYRFLIVLALHQRQNIMVRRRKWRERAGLHSKTTEISRHSNQNGIERGALDTSATCGPVAEGMKGLRGVGVGGGRQHLHGAGCNGQRAENTWQGHPFAHITVFFVVNGTVHAGAAFICTGDRTKLALQRVRCSISKIRVQGTCVRALSHSEDFALQV